MRRIRVVAAKIVEQRVKEAQESLDSDGALPPKKDVMSLLIQARMREEGEPGMKMTDEMVMEQAVSRAIYLIAQLSIDFILLYYS